MICSRGKAVLVSLLVTMPAATVFAAAPTYPAILNFDRPSDADDSDIDPGVIPNSAVASSDNCARITNIEEQLEHGITPQDLDRIQGPEQGPPLGVSGKFRLAVANFSDPFAMVITALDSELGDATSGPSPLPRGATGFA